MCVPQHFLPCFKYTISVNLSSDYITSTFFCHVTLRHELSLKRRKAMVEIPPVKKLDNSICSRESKKKILN